MRSDPILSPVEGPVLSPVEGPVLSPVEGPILSPAEGRDRLVPSGIEGNAIVYLGLGANLGDPMETCARAVEAMRHDARLRPVQCSSFYRTEPVGIVDQPWFINLTVEAATALTPRDLLLYCRDLERAFGRKHRLRGAPRELDVDLLLYGNLICEEPDLLIPHPRLHERRFVLEPLAEIAPGVRHPLLGLTVRELLERCEDPHRIERLCPVSTTSPSKAPSA